MKEFVTLADIDEAAGAVKTQITHQPIVGIIHGSGLGSLADRVENAETIPYERIPNWRVSTVVGHQGKLVVGLLEGVQVLVMQGRTHYYEGYSLAEVTMPIRVMKRLGIDTIVITNAAGAIYPDFEPGDVMLITDHINMLGMGGANPLRGPNLDVFGPRFPDMSQAYDRQYHLFARQAAKEAGMDLKEGVYVGLAGPSFETPADLRFLRAIGSDAVGMSTVAEVTVARHAGQRVLGLSGISNKANLDGNTMTSHEEVLAAGQVLVPKLQAIITGFLKHL